LLQQRDVLILLGAHNAHHGFEARVLSGP
jgi:hypothetical protein